MGRPRKPAVPYPDHEIKGQSVLLVESELLPADRLPLVSKIISKVSKLTNWAKKKRGPEPNAQIIADLVVVGLHLLRNEGRELPTRQPEWTYELMEVFDRHGVGPVPRKRLQAQFVGPRTEIQTKELVSGWESEIAPHLPEDISDDARLGYWRCWADELVPAEYRVDAKPRKSPGRAYYVSEKDAEPDFYSYYLRRAARAIKLIERLTR